MLVSAGGIKPDPDSVRAIVEYPTPKTAKGIRSFMGLCQYFRRSIRNCAHMCAPLIDAIKAETIFGAKLVAKRKEKGRSDLNKVKSGAPIKWTPQCQRAFEQLKHALSNAPLLRHPDFDQRFYIDVDSSKLAVGAVLSQQYEGTEHPVAYYSKRYSTAEGKRSSMELEALGIVYTLEHWRPYI